MIAAVVILAVLGIQYSLRAADLDMEGREMFRVLHEQQGWPMPTSYPTYHLGITEDTTELCRKVAHYACYSRGHVWITAALLADDAARKAVLLHENVHHLQWEKAGDSMNCQQNWERERAAYKAQQIYLSENFHKYLGVTLPVCPPEQGGPR